MVQYNYTTMIASLLKLVAIIERGLLYIERYMYA